MHCDRPCCSDPEMLLVSTTGRQRSRSRGGNVAACAGELRSTVGTAGCRWDRLFGHRLPRGSFSGDRPAEPDTESGRRGNSQDSLAG
jgi:hypothetical protein